MFEGLVRSLVAYLILKNVGTAEDYRSAENSIMMAVTRVANRQRLHRNIPLDQDGNPLKMPKGGDGTKKWLVTAEPGPRRPGQFFRFFDESENLTDDFIKQIVDNTSLTKDPLFLDSMKQLKVRYF